MTTPRYPFVRLDCEASRADELSGAFFDLGATGVEERDATTFLKGPAGDHVRLVASFDSHEAANEAIAELRARGEGLEPELEEVVGDAWRDAWKEHFKPFALTPRLVVAPPWLDAPEAPDGAHVLVLEPGRAFGTGLHATTSLVAELLEARAASLASTEVLDAGTGSGILALAALLFGAPRAVGFDIDEEATKTALENAERNGLAGRLEAFTGEARDVKKPFALVLANIETRYLVPMAAELAATVAPGGTLVLSGILARETSAIEHAYGAELGLALVETKARSDAETGAIYNMPDDWVAMVFERRAGG